MDEKSESQKKYCGGLGRSKDCVFAGSMIVNECLWLHRSGNRAIAGIIPGGTGHHLSYAQVPYLRPVADFFTIVDADERFPIFLCAEIKT
jgi:hypothetical protein